jgi:16S rRNA (adenine1518-N6/adenine1519-N6)-dimethyltransferase
MALLEQKRPVEAITELAQKEAAQRICAEMPSRAAGAVTAAVRWHSEPELLFEVKREAFAPPPDVDSAVIRLNVRKTPPVPVKDEAMFFRVVKGAFAQRRKTALNSLSAFFAMDKPAMAEILSAAGVKATARAEQLALGDFAKIADSLLR